MKNKAMHRELDGRHALEIASSLTWRYAIALALVASLSSAAWFSLHLVISEQESTAAVVNVSGRQRMLSQRTALFSNLLITSTKQDRQLVRSKLKDAIELMEKSHRGLTQGDREMGLPATMSPAVHAMYFDGASPLDNQVTTYIKSVQDLLQVSDEALTADNPTLHYITSAAPNELVKALDQMVKQYQMEGEASVKRLEKAETIFWLLTLLLLMLEAALIFHPFIRHIRAVIGKLQIVTDELRLHQDHLNEMIELRTAQLESRSKELAESEEKFRLISASAQDAIIMVNPSEEIAYWNPAAEKIFEYREEEAIGKNLHDLLTPLKQRDMAHKGFDAFHYSGEGNFIGKTFEITALRRNGDEFSVELSVSAIKLKNTWHALGIIRDISERKLTELELERHRQHLEVLVEERTAALSIAKEAAEAANRAKSTFLANMSHELRTPMNGIMGMTSIARRQATDSRLIAQLSTIDQASHDLLRIINDILDISKIEAERMTLEQVSFNLGEVLDKVRNLTAQRIQEKKLEFETDLPPEISPLTLLGDPLRLGQILLNLTGNAIKFTEQGCISLRVRILEESAKDVFIHFEVEDTGVGIAEADQKRLFSAFEQADGSTTRKYGGTGLGLAISKHLVHLMGGDIGVDSMPGQGSTFWFNAQFVKVSEPV